MVLPFMALIALGLFARTAGAEEAAARIAPAQMTLWAEKLPLDFHTVTQRIGLKVVGIERLEALGTNVVYIEPSEGQSHDKALQELNSQFPNAQFERIDDKVFQLVE